MIERTVTLILAVTLAVLMAAGVRYNLEQINSAIAQRLEVLRTVAERR